MNKRLRFPFIYIATVLIVSWTFTIILFSNSENIGMFPLIMYFPALLAIIIGSIQYKSIKTLFQPVYHRINLKSILFAVIYPLVFIFVCAVLVYTLQLAGFNAEKLSNLKSVPPFIGLLIGISLMFGEEFGWRGYLLKELEKVKGKTFAAIVVGIVWALWHAPIVYGLAVNSHMDNPFLVMTIQMGAVFVFSMPFAYSYFLTKNILPAMIFHFVWNTYNPIVLGNIYRNIPGIMEGRILLINGEGLIGFILGLIAMFWFMKKFQS